MWRDCLIKIFANSVVQYAKIISIFRHWQVKCPLDEHYQQIPIVCYIVLIFYDDRQWHCYTVIYTHPAPCWPSFQLFYYTFSIELTVCQTKLNWLLKCLENILRFFTYSGFVFQKISILNKYASIRSEGTSLNNIKIYKWSRLFDTHCKKMSWN